MKTSLNPLDIAERIVKNPNAAKIACDIGTIMGGCVMASGICTRIIIEYYYPKE